MAAALDLSVVIVTWNATDLLGPCLTALPAAMQGLASELIIVDNASTDGTPEMVAREYPAARLLRNDSNVGFARANNRGMAAAQGRYFALLNADTIARPGSLAQMVAFMDGRPAAAAASPRLVRPDGTAQPYAFGDDPTPVYLLRRALAHKRRVYLHDWAIREPVRAAWVSGACLVARRGAVAQVGGLDENIFMYFEDNDWCRRMRLAGWEVWYNPLAEIVHMGGASLNRNPQARAAYYESLAYFYRKHYGPVAGALMGLLVKVRRG